MILKGTGSVVLLTYITKINTKGFFGLHNVIKIKEIKSLLSFDIFLKIKKSKTH